MDNGGLAKVSWQIHCHTSVEGSQLPLNLKNKMYTHQWLRWHVTESIWKHVASWRLTQVILSCQSEDERCSFLRHTWSHFFRDNVTSCVASFSRWIWRRCYCELRGLLKMWFCLFVRADSKRLNYQRHRVLLLMLGSCPTGGGKGGKKCFCCLHRRITAWRFHTLMSFTASLTALKSNSKRSDKLKRKKAALLLIVQVFFLAIIYTAADCSLEHLKTTTRHTMPQSL